MNRPFVCKEIEQHAVVAHPFFAERHEWLPQGNQVEIGCVIYTGLQSDTSWLNFLQRSRRDKMKLHDKVAIVTGASKGIGSAIAKGMAQAGAKVVINYASDRPGAEKTV